LNQKPAAVLATVKSKSLRDGLRPPLTVTARRFAMACGHP